MPAVIERSVGAGKVLLFNTTADDSWSDLPRRKSYVPLVDRLLNYLSGGGVRRSFEVGDPVTLPLADWKAGDMVAVVTPGGVRLTPVLATAGGRTLLRLDGVGEPGVYRVERTTPERNFAFVVNAGRGDSVLTPMDAAALERWWAPQPRLQATVVLPDERQLPLAFAADPVEPGVFIADFVTAQPGAYRIQAAVSVEGKTAAETSATLDVGPARSESDATQVDPANLARIAAATGGRVVDPTNPDSWPPGGPRTRRPTPEVQSYDLWHNYSLLLVLCGLLGADWLVRLLRGYM